MKIVKKWPAFKNAPIVEAVFDVRLPPASATLSEIDNLGGQLPSQYRPSRDLFEWDGHVRTVGSVGPEERGSRVGRLYRSLDGLHAVQLRTNGLSYSRLPPYRNWDDFISEGQSLWRLSFGALKLTKAVRIGIRFINRIAIPKPIRGYESFLKSLPHAPSNYDLGLLSFTSRLEVWDPKCKLHAAIAHVVPDKGQNPHSVGAIIDIDVFRQKTSPVDAEGDLGEFRDLKNRLFFALLTRKTLALFKR